MRGLGRRVNKRFKTRRDVSRFDGSEHSGFFLDRTGSDNGNVGEDVDQDTRNYFLRVAEQLTLGFENPESRDVFFSNVFEQSKGKEVELSCNKRISFCMQSLLEACEDTVMIMQFLEAFSYDFGFICTHPYASHVMQALLQAVLQTQSNAQLSEQDNNYSEEREKLMNGVLNFGCFCLENADHLLQDPNACHVVRFLLEVLGCHRVDEAIVGSRKSLKRKQESHGKDGIPAGVSPKLPSSDVEVPKEFLVLLKKFAKYIWKKSDLEDWSLDKKTCPFIQILLLVLHKKEPRYCQRMVKMLVRQLLMCSNEPNVPLLLTDETGTRLTEVILHVANEKRHARMWNLCFRGLLVQLALHPIGNFVVQRLFKTITNKDQFQVMCQGIGPHLQNVMATGHSGVLISLSEACVRLGTGQALFTQMLMETLHCWEPTERQSFLAPLLLHFASYEVYHGSATALSHKDASMEISLPGSVLLQNLLHFHKPIKVVKSLLVMPPAELQTVLCDPRGSHSMDAFMKSLYVGEKNREAMIQQLKTHYVALACDKYGSRVLDSIWAVATLNQKCIIAKELADKESILNNNVYGKYVARNCGLYHFKHRPQDWRQVQDTCKRRRDMFADIL